MTDHQKWLQKWIRIRRELFRQLQSEVWHRLGEEGGELVKYRQEYDREFGRKWQASTKKDLIETIRDKKLIFLGDFHALQQSQKAHLRILKELDPGVPMVLALECFFHQDQTHLDRFLQGKGTEKEFLKAIQWQKKWGFPWEHYRPLVRWAQKNKVRIIGLNTEVGLRVRNGLKVRDRFAAKRVDEILRTSPSIKCIVIYGDLHLAQAHLPAEIIKLQGTKIRTQMMRIFQNAERIYFQLLKKELEGNVDLVRFSGDDFCLMNIPPWVKWQNYLMYLEESYDVDLFDDEDDDEDELEYTDHVGRYVQIMTDELGLPNLRDDLSVYTAQDPLFWEKVENQFKEKDLKTVQTLVEEGISFYLPELEIAYLARASVNHAASLAMQFVHAKVSGRSRLFNRMPEDFFRQIWVEAVAYFGSKIINHKRKTDTIVDIKASLAAKHADQGKEILMLALSQKMNELMVISGQGTRGRSPFVPQRKNSYVQAARVLGGMLGERMYEGYRKKILNSSAVHSFLKKKVESDKFELLYYEMLEIIEALPAPFQSKREKL